MPWGFGCRSPLVQSTDCNQGTQIIQMTKTIIWTYNICVSHSVNNGTVPKWGNGTFRPRTVSATVFGETTLISWTFRPQNVNDSANKYECFGQINYIAAETSLQNWCLSSAILIAAAIVTHVSLYLWCHCLIFVSGFLCFCFQLPFLAFLSDVAVPK